MADPARRRERTREDGLRHRLEPRLVAAERDPRDNDDHGTDRERGNSDRAREPMHGLAEKETREAVDHRPDHAADGIEEEKAAPRHPVGAGEQRRQSPQHRDEAAEEDDLPAMAEEEIPTDLQPRLC